MDRKEKQRNFLDWEIGVFFHFGIRTFNEGHKDWDMIEMAAADFNPTELDCDRWIDAIKKAGAKYAMLVCKHHDGFALWPTKYSDYSVASSPWKNGKGDVVHEYVNACRKYGIKVGLYYSPAQFGFTEMSAKEYDDYFVNQISELLSNYGKIDYLWFDGCGSENHEYDTERIVAVIRELQPDIMIFNMWDPDTRWIGNEAGIASLDENGYTSSIGFSVQTNRQDKLDEEIFLPGECDCRMRLDNWFYSENDEHTVKSPEEIFGLYLMSVGMGSNLLINIGPDKCGLLPEKDINSFLEFGNMVKERFSKPIVTFADFKKEENIYTAKIDDGKLVQNGRLVKYIVIKEDYENSQICDYQIEIEPHGFGESKCIYKGAKIGHKAICPIPPVIPRGIKIVINDGKGTLKLTDIEAF